MYDRFKKGNPEYDRYIHSGAWRQKAEGRMRLDGGICQVCGRKASDVHHLTYDHFGSEEMDDLVSLCRTCHNKAEELYDPSVIPWAMDEVKPEGNNFMAAMRVDAVAVASEVFDYLKEARGCSFDVMMELRQPDDAEGKRYWSVLKKAVDALCRKRYFRNCVEDRADMMLHSIWSHTAVICLQQIEHCIRNRIQADLHETVMVDYALFGKWKDVAEELGITYGTMQKFRSDDGTSFGPSLRESVLYYLGLDSVAGIAPMPGFTCISAEDYDRLNAIAEYMASVSGSEKFKGEWRSQECLN